MLTLILTLQSLFFFSSFYSSPPLLSPSSFTLLIPCPPCPILSSFLILSSSYSLSSLPFSPTPFSLLLYYPYPLHSSHHTACAPSNCLPAHCLWQPASVHGPSYHAWGTDVLSWRVPPSLSSVCATTTASSSTR